MKTAARRILVAEDDHQTRVAFRKALEDEGYQIVTATNGQTALEILRGKDHFDLVILDMAMPLMDGAEFLQRRQGDPGIAGIPVVAMLEAKDAVPHLVDGVLIKPVELAELLSAVRQQVG